jgi:DNA topoisomerase-1
LHHADDSKPGITRKKAGHGWGYWDADGKRITDRDEIDRLNAIGLPPPIATPGICPIPTAISRRPAGTRRAASNIAITPISASAGIRKYERCADFGRALPKLRAQVERGSQARSGSAARRWSPPSSACSTSAISASATRGYAKANKSFGATTLRNRHANDGARR